MASTPNVQPVYTKDIFNWGAKLTDQVIGRKLTVETPVFLGTFGAFGGVVWSIRAIPLGVNPATNLRIVGYPPDGASAADYQLLFEVGLPTIEDTTNRTNTIITSTNKGVNSNNTPIEIPLPRIYTRNTEESRGLVRTSSYSLFCGLSSAVTDGWDVFIEGGNY